MGGKLAELNRAAPICTSERFGLAELKQRRACQLSSPSPWHSGLVPHNAFASSFPSLILNGLSCLHFPCEISPPSRRAHHYEILSNLGGFSFFFFFIFSLLSAGSLCALGQLCPHVCSPFPAPGSRGFMRLSWLSSFTQRCFPGRGTIQIVFLRFHFHGWAARDVVLCKPFELRLVHCLLTTPFPPALKGSWQ